MTVADRIKKRRMELGLSQEELANRANYKDKTSICHLEHLGNEITMKQVKRLAPALECTQAYLMGWEEQEPEPAKNDIQALKDALSLYEAYSNADPSVRAAVELLLKSSQPGS